MVHFLRFALFFVILIPGKYFSQVTESVRELNASQTKGTVRTRIPPPKGYHWLEEEAGSFGDYLVNFPLHPNGFPVRDFRGIPIERQYNHVALLKIDVGEKDLQQCADAWMRLYAEYLWMKHRADEVVFSFTSGQRFAWKDYKNGLRTLEGNKGVVFRKTTEKKTSYEAFRDYLEVIFLYAGTISLDKESVSVLRNEDIRTGDIIIKPGSPGHSVFVVGTARDASGKRVFLLAESFMPAQDIHIIKNPNNAALSPWYELDVNAEQLRTAKYLFKPVSIKRFRAL